MMTTIFIIWDVIGFISSIFLFKIVDGQVTIGKLFLSILLGLLGIFALVMLIFEFFKKTKWLDKKLF